MFVVVKAASSSKKKNKKKAKATAAPKSSSSLSVDSGFLCCSYQEVMVAGLAMLGVDSSQDKCELTPACPLSWERLSLHLSPCLSVGAAGGTGWGSTGPVSKGLCAKCYR